MIHQECPTCADCPMFSQFEGDNRGLCKLFDKVARSHWKITGDCELNLPSKSFEIQLESQETDDDGYSWLHNLIIWANSEKEAVEELFLFHTEILKTHNYVGISVCGIDYEF